MKRTGGWIRLDKDLIEDDPRVLQLGELYARWLYRELIGEPPPSRLSDALLHAARAAIVGHLASLWRHADRYLDAENRLQLTLGQLATVVHAPVEVLQQFPAMWLATEEDGRVVLPNYIAKNKLISRDRRRKLGNARMQRFRARRRADEAVAEAQRESTKPTEAVTRVVTASPTTSHARPRARPRETETKTLLRPPLTPPPAEGATAAEPRRNGSDRSSRSVHARSLNAWTLTTLAVDETARTPGYTWAHAKARVGPIADEAVTRLGGYRLIAERTQFTTTELKRRFRALFEEIESAARLSPPVPALTHTDVESTSPQGETAHVGVNGIPLQNRKDRQ
jgi:hypothetical protein